MRPNRNERLEKAKTSPFVSSSPLMKATAPTPISSNEVDTSPGTAGDAGVVEQDHLAIPGQAVRHRRVPIVHRASECWLKTSRPICRSGGKRTEHPPRSRTESARSGNCAGSLRFPLAVALKPTCEAVESGRRPDAAKAARRVPQEERPLTGRGASLRARTGSVNGLTAVDVEDMAGDE